MSEYNLRTRPYRITASLWDRGNLFADTFTVHAYDRVEALAQFRERRVNLKFVPPVNLTISPLGSQCECTCEPACGGEE